jgi:hypothetical protein
MHDRNFGRTPRLGHLAYTSQFAGATATTLYGIDDEPEIPDNLVTIGGPGGVPDQGQVFSVGPTDGWSGFTIGGTANTAFALSQEDNALWTVDLATGTGTLVRPTGISDTVTGLAALLATPTPPGSLPALSIDDVTVNESQGGAVDAVFTITLSAPSSQAVTVQVATRDGTALSPQEYQPLALTTLTFSPQQTSLTITVPVYDNRLVGGVETFSVRMSNPTGATLAKAEGWATITNHVLVTTPDNRLLVEDFYLDMLGRLPDAAGQAYWQGLLDAGASRESVAQSILTSGEYTAAQVEDLYSRLLGRPADPLGLQNAVTALAGGMPLDRLEAAMLGSPEYLAEHGGTGAGFLQGVYRDMLGRQLDPAGAAFWSSALAAGELPALVAEQIVHSAEAVQSLVNAHYRRYLRRNADPEAAHTWVARIQVDWNAILRMDRTMGGSVEFYNQAPRQLFDRAYVTKLYHDLLGREPDPGGLAYWAGMLEQGVSREQVVFDIVTEPSSHEYRTRLINQIGQDYGGSYYTGFNPDSYLQFFGDTTLPGGGTIADVRVQIFLDGHGDVNSLVTNPSLNDPWIVTLFQDFMGITVDPSTSTDPLVQEVRRNVNALHGLEPKDLAYDVLNDARAGTFLATHYFDTFLGQNMPQPDPMELVNMGWSGAVHPDPAAGPFFGAIGTTGTILDDFFNGGGRVTRAEEIFTAVLLGTNEYFLRS